MTEALLPLRGLALGLAVALVGGCGRGAGDEPTQVAARVNSDEITVHQINYLLARTPDVTAQNARQMKRRLLARLVDEQLLQQQAVKDKLDRNPEVLQALEFARSGVLTRAYVGRLAAKLPKPTDAEVKRYYAAHPELFARRRVFDLDEVVFTAKGDAGKGLRQEVAKARSMQDVTGWLKSRGIAYSENKAVRAAEEVPLGLLPKLDAMQDGQIAIAGDAAGRYDVVQVAGSKAAPVGEAEAAPRIRQYLFNRRLSEAVAAEVKRLRAGAKISYLGEFAHDGGTPQDLEKGVRGLLK